VLALYHRRWQGKNLGPKDVVLSPAELTQLQALSRRHPGAPAAPGQSARCELQYERHGTLCYRAFLDQRPGVRRDRIQDGSMPFDRALGHCLKQERYRDAERIFRWRWEETPSG